MRNERVPKGLFRRGADAAPAGNGELRLVCLRDEARRFCPPETVNGGSYVLSRAADHPEYRHFLKGNFPEAFGD